MRWGRVWNDADGRTHTGATDATNRPILAVLSEARPRSRGHRERRGKEAKASTRCLRASSMPARILPGGQAVPGVRIPSRLICVDLSGDTPSVRPGHDVFGAVWMTLGDQRVTKERTGLCGRLDLAEVQGDAIVGTWGIFLGQHQYISEWGWPLWAPITEALYITGGRTTSAG